MFGSDRIRRLSGACLLAAFVGASAKASAQHVFSENFDGVTAPALPEDGSRATPRARSRSG